MENKNEELDFLVKYPSLINHFEKSAIELSIAHNPWVKKDSYVVYEKLHGSNTQIIITRDKAEYCSRIKNHGSVIEDIDYFGFNKIGHEYDALIDAFRAELLNENTEVVSVTLYGEFFGGGIQKGINYGTKKRLSFFDIAVNGKLLSQRLFLGYMRMLGFEHLISPILAELVSFEVALAVSNCLSSELSPTGDTMEGTVIKPMNIPYLRNDRPFYIKNKNEKFKERKKNRTRVKDVDPIVEEVTNLFLEYINENRLMNVCSKHGFPKTSKDIGVYIRLLLEDAAEDFYREHPYRNMEKIINKCGCYCVPHIKKFIGY